MTDIESIRQDIKQLRTQQGISHVVIVFLVAICAWMQISHSTAARHALESVIQHSCGSAAPTPALEAP